MRKFTFCVVCASLWQFRVRVFDTRKRGARGALDHQSDPPDTAVSGIGGPGGGLDSLCETRMCRALKILAWAALGFAGSAAAFVPAVPPGSWLGSLHVVDARRAGAPAQRAGADALRVPHRGAGAGRRLTAGMRMDVERARGAPRVRVVNSPGEWSELLAAGSDSGSMVMVFFKKEFCRKCEAMRPKFAKLSRDLSGLDVQWAEANGVKLGKELRTQLKLNNVPSFQLWSRGEMLEHFDEEIDLTKSLLRDLSLASIGVENVQVQAPGKSAVKGTSTRVHEVERRLRLDSS